MIRFESYESYPNHGDAMISSLQLPSWVGCNSATVLVALRQGPAGRKGCCTQGAGGEHFGIPSPTSKHHPDLIAACVLFGYPCGRS